MKKYFRNIAVGGLVLLTGCNNFLDVVPDDRTLPKSWQNW